MLSQTHANDFWYHGTLLSTCMLQSSQYCMSATLYIYLLANLIKDA